MFSSIKSKIESTFDCRIYRNSIPHGTDMFMDLNKSFGVENFKTVFDIGANIGQSALHYLEAFPSANIYSFEPVASTYAELVSNTKGKARVHNVKSGMGSKQGSIEINVNPVSRTNSILHSRAEDHPETIFIDTISDFCAGNKINTIDFLKIDTEGYEMEVLEGSRSLLENQQIKLILAECEPMDKSNYFVSFAELSTFLYSFNYELFGIYEQQLHWEGKKSIMYFNAMFVCKSLTESK